MQEIIEGIFIEASYPGVTLGAINLPHGLILVDAPPRPEDVRSWRAALLNLGGGVERLLVNLDAHIDRTLGARAMECTVAAHCKTAQVFRNRPTTFKAQNTETGAEWEQINGLGSIRWSPPEIAFSDTLSIYWGDTPVSLEYHPGPNPGAIWVSLPEQKVVFVGDAVTPKQPPFFAHADLPAWIGTLETLLSAPYDGYLIVSGRNGLATVDEVHQQLETIQKVHSTMEDLVQAPADGQAIDHLVPELLAGMQISPERQEMYSQRLHWGLENYFTHHYNSSDNEEEE
jgi:cyclase